jgi:hypothetical protein
VLAKAIVSTRLRSVISTRTFIRSPEGLRRGMDIANY